MAIATTDDLDFEDTQHGRPGYSLPPGLDFERESERQWGQLKTR